MQSVTLSSKTYPGLVALVDDTEYEALSRYTWYPIVTPRASYARTSISGKPVYMHRMIMGAGPGQEVDHEDHNGLNNQRYNLRLATKRQNGYHKQRSIHNTSGYKGVTWYQNRGRWMARIGKNGKSTFLGLFDDPVEAAKAYDRAAAEMHGAFAKLNLPADTIEVEHPDDEERS